MRLIQTRSTIPTDQSRREVVVDAVIFAAIVAVAAVTRLTSLDLVEFVDDEPRVASLAEALLEGRLLPLVGIPSSVGVNNPPVFVYLIAIPLALSRDPAVAMEFIAVLDVAAVLLCYRLCDEYFDRRTAQIAALLFASAPGAIVFSRKIQQQDVVPFFGVLLVGSIFHVISGRGRYRISTVPFPGLADGLGFPPILWRLGDMVVSWFTLTPSPPGPAGPSSIELGDYRRSDVARFPLRAPDGTTTDHVLLGPLKVTSGDTQSP